MNGGRKDQIRLTEHIHHFIFLKKEVVVEYNQHIDMLERATMESGVVNSFYYEGVEILDILNDINYPVVIYTPNSSQVNSQNNRIDEYNGRLTYVDRLTETRRKRDIHSTAHSVLHDIVNRYRDYNYMIDEDGGIYTVDLGQAIFYSNQQNFSDGLTGAYATIDIITDNEIGDCYFTNQDICENS